MNKRVVKIVRRSTKYNAHINNVGEIARVDHEGDDWAQVCTTTGGMGSVDRDAVEDVDFETLTAKQKHELKTMVGT